MCFDGCGVTDGCLGTVFAVGLKRQCASVVKRTKLLMSCLDQPLHLVVLGLSRGAIAALYLTKFLARLSKNELVTSILLFDAVPGNLVCTSRFLDCLRCCTTANQCIDVSSSRNLQRVLALYPHEPLCDLAFHAPLLASYPSETIVEEDVTIGCHQGAVYWGTPSYGFPAELARSGLVSFERIYTFLLQVGCPLQEKQILDFLAHHNYDSMRSLRQAALQILKEEALSRLRSRRIAHSRRGCRSLVLRSPSPPCKWLNRHHMQLSGSLGKSLHSSDGPEDFFILRVEHSC